MKLLYDATDWSFAQRAVAELRSAGIPCYLSGESSPDLTSGESDCETSPPDVSKTPEEPDPKDFEETPEEAERRSARERSDGEPDLRRYIPTYPIYVYSDEDYQRASDILIKLGAAKEVMLNETTIEAINRWSIALAVITVIIIVLFVLENRH